MITRSHPYRLPHPVHSVLSVMWMWSCKTVVPQGAPRPRGCASAELLVREPGSTSAVSYPPELVSHDATEAGDHFPPRDASSTHFWSMVWERWLTSLSSMKALSNAVEKACAIVLEEVSYYAVLWPWLGQQTHDCGRILPEGFHS